MAKIIDLRNSGGQMILLGDAFVLPSATDSAEPNIAGSIRYNPDSEQFEGLVPAGWLPLGSGGGGGTIAITETITASTSSVTLVDPNAYRNSPGVVIQNYGAGDLYVRLGSSPASLIDYDVIVEPGMTATVGPAHLGAIQGIWTVSGGSAEITEYT